MAGPFKYELLVTADGSHTLYVPELKENYHSGFGAHTESQHIFIQGGLLKAFSEFRGTLRILEAGFGTGLNALLSLDAAARYQRKLHYTGIEAYPLPGELISQLNYTTDRYPEHHDAFIAMHRALDALQQRPDHLLIDGNRFITYADIPHTCLIKGDGRFRSIAAASILAKTHRDELMVRLHNEHPEYGWAVNKGYPTVDHRDALDRIGPCVHHRKSFRLSYAEPELF